MGAENTLLQALAKISQNAEETTKPATLEFGEVISEEYAPLEIKIHDKLILDEDFLELTNAVRDHWVDVEVYWQTIDDNDLAEFQAVTDANVAIHNSNTEKYNAHTHTNGNNGSPTGALTTPDKMKMEPVATRHTSHLHNIAGRKRLRVYNGLHKGEKVILLRMRGGQKYLVLDRITDHIVGGEWQTHAGAVITTQETAPFVPEGLPGWTEGATSESKWANAAKPAKFMPGAPGPE